MPIVFDALSPAVLYRVNQWLHDLNGLLTLKKILKVQDYCSFQILNLQLIQVKIKRPLLVHWRLPPVGKLKFNINGSSLGNPGLLVVVEF